MYFIQGNKGENKWWMYAAGIFLVIFAYMVGQFPVMLITQHFLDQTVGSPSIEAFFANPDFSSIGMSNNVGFLLLLLMFVLAFIALYLVVVNIHKKKFMDLINTDSTFSWSRVFFGFAVWMVLLAIAEYLIYLENPSNYLIHFNARSFLPLVLISLFVLPIQTSFEEIFFRGYLMQGLYVLVRQKWFGIVVSSILFMGVHATNPEIESFGFGIMMCYYFSAGLLLGIVTALDNRLELALGMHAGMNVFGAVFVGYEGGVIQTDSIFKATEINPNFMLIGLIISGLIFIAISYKKFSWNMNRLFHDSVVRDL